MSIARLGMHTAPLLPPKQKIHRPRQIYVGSTERPYVGIAQRG